MHPLKTAEARWISATRAQRAYREGQGFTQIRGADGFTRIFTPEGTVRYIFATDPTADPNAGRVEEIPAIKSDREPGPDLASVGILILIGSAAFVGTCAWWLLKLVFG